MCSCCLVEFFDNVCDFLGGVSVEDLILDCGLVLFGVFIFLIVKFGFLWLFFAVGG